MDAGMVIGVPVRYTRTGTVGTITRIEERGGHSYAELDSTHMLYRTDLLIPTAMAERNQQVQEHEAGLKQVERELNRESSFDEMPSMDSACNGAG